MLQLAIFDRVSDIVHDTLHKFDGNVKCDFLEKYYLRLSLFFSKFFIHFTQPPLDFKFIGIIIQIL